MAGHPLIAVVAPSPIAGDPNVLGRGLGQHDFLLQSRWCLGNDGGADDGHGGGGSRVAGILHDHRHRRVGGGSGCHGPGRRGRRGSGNHMGIWF